MPGTSVDGGYDYSDDLTTRMEIHRGEVNAADTKEVHAAYALHVHMSVAHMRVHVFIGTSEPRHPFV